MTRIRPAAARCASPCPWNGAAAAAWQELREWDELPVDPDGTIVTEELWHQRREAAKLAKLPRLNRAQAMKDLRQAIAIGGDERRRCIAWRRLRDHRVRLLTFDRRTEITEQVWRAWVAEGKFCHDPAGCVISGVG